MESTYEEHARAIEDDLGPHAFTTRDIATFVDGTDAIAKYERDWRDPDSQPRLLNRTPLMIERDRIVYDDSFRRMTDRHHILFQGQHRIFRNYMTQTLRTAQVARAVATALDLNPDFAEALALGGKVGALPFVHVSKLASCEWAMRKLRDLDDKADRVTGQSAMLDTDGTALPQWLLGIRSSDLRRRVAQAIPHAVGDPLEAFYTSGKESFWMLSVQPFLRRPLPRTPFLPQTLYGIWRHSRGTVPTDGSFEYRADIFGGGEDSGISARHATFEALVVQYADDITWIIENLNDANSTSRLLSSDGEGRVFRDFLRQNGHEALAAPLVAAVGRADPGGIYTFFINDLVKTSRAALDEWDRGSLGAVDAGVNLPIRLSPRGVEVLESMAGFLRAEVFAEARVSNRNEMLRVITTACLDILFSQDNTHLSDYAERHARRDGWKREDREVVQAQISDPIARIQLAIDVLAQMSDQDIYEFTGLESI